jgi:hypothetical protein
LLGLFVLQDEVGSECQVKQTVLQRRRTSQSFCSARASTILG